MRVVEAVRGVLPTLLVVLVPPVLSTAAAAATVAAVAGIIVTRCAVLCPGTQAGILGLVDRVVVDDDAAAVAVLALGGEGLQQTGAQTLAGHLHQAQ